MQWLLFILLSLFTTQLFGQIITLSYDEAVALALKQNVSLRKQENEMKIVKAMKAQSIGEMAPLPYRPMSMPTMPMEIRPCRRKPGLSIHPVKDLTPHLAQASIFSVVLRR
jgi:hypothetical protein